MDLPVAIAPIPTVTVLQRLAVGPDPEAWAVLVERHGQAVFRAAYRVTADHALAEDATQEAFLHIRSDAGRFRPQPGDAEAAAQGWIVRIACTSALQLMRRLSRQHRHEHHYAVEHARGRMHDPHDRDDEADQPGLDAALRRELAELPESHRLPLMLHFCGGLDYRRIAEQVGCSPGNARVRVHRALERLRARLQRAGFATGAAAIAGQLHAAEAGTTVDPALLAKCHALLASGKVPVLSSSAVFGVSLGTKLGMAAAVAIGLGALAVPVLHRSPPPPLPAPAAVLVVAPPAPASEPAHAAPPSAPVQAAAHVAHGTIAKIDHDERRLVLKDGEHFEFYGLRRHGEGQAAASAQDTELAQRFDALAIGNEVEIGWEPTKLPATEPLPDVQHHKHPHRVIVSLTVRASGGGQQTPF